MKKFLIIIFLSLLHISSSSADTPHFLDFKMILNESIAGKKAQTFLKKKIQNGFKNIKENEKNILEEEKKIIQQKKIISNDEYQKKVSELRKKVSTIQKERNDLLQSTAKQRSKAKDTLLKNLNPIVRTYMIEKKIRIVIDKKYVLLGDDNLDITNDIIDLLNKKLKTINLN
jgi:outer membrane protein